MKRARRFLRVSAALVLVMCIAFFPMPAFEVEAAENSNPVVAIDCCGWGMTAITQDGTLWSWGVGPLGNGKRNDSATPQSILDNVRFANGNAAIKNDDTLWTWGEAWCGSIGDGTSQDRLSPVKIMSDVKTVSAHGSTKAAVKNDGSLWLWGEAEYNASFYLDVLGDDYEFDDDTYYDSIKSPIKVMDNGVSDVCVIGNECIAIIKNDNSLWVWGDDTNNTPARILTDVREVMEGYVGAAIKTDGSLYQWRYDDEGKRQLTKILDDVDEYSFGSAYNYGYMVHAAVKTDGSLWTWGNIEYPCVYGPFAPLESSGNYYNEHSEPVKIMDGVSHVSLGDTFGAIIESDGTVWTGGGAEVLDSVGNSWWLDDFFGGERFIRVIPVPQVIVSGLSNATYTGKPITPKPVIKVDGQLLQEGKDYQLEYEDNKNVGTASVYIKNIDGVRDMEKTFKILKANNPLTVKAKTYTVKYKKLKKKAQTLAVTKVLSFTKPGQGSMSYALSAAKNGKKNFKKYFKINKSTGKVTVKKKLKKGTYKVTVKVKANGNANYNASAVKTVTFKVKVK